jgi:hypothetical protein
MCIKVWGVGLPPLRRPSLFWGLPPPRPPGWGGCRRPKAPAAAPPTGVGAPQHKAEDLRDGSPPDSVGTVWAPIKIYIFGIVSRGPKPSQNAPPWGPESTPKAQKRSPRAIPNDSWVGQNSSKNIFFLNESKGQARLCAGAHSRCLQPSDDPMSVSPLYSSLSLAQRPAATTRL